MPRTIALLVVLVCCCACSSSTEMVPLLTAAGIPLTDPTEAPLRVVTSTRGFTERWSRETDGLRTRFFVSANARGPSAAAAADVAR